MKWGCMYSWRPLNEMWEQSIAVFGAQQTMGGGGGSSPSFAP